MVIDRGFHEVSGADIPGILDEAARQGVPVFTLSTAGRTDKEAFFGAVRRTLPLDPPLGPRMVWDALSDSVWGGLHELRSPRVVIVWPDARPVAGAEGDFWIALSILRDVAESLAEARHTSGRPTQVSVYIAQAPSAGETAPPKG
ncbi:barstar family protein [Streptomyces sp. NEAU-H22]|uniref:barstar family protein n=1 Tax=unclassified Streptomyces TaxID=2593676 RepID=UPI0022581166|nr:MULTISPECIES: barstar family protein [unclassified Streptomyces]MCX3287233.1 barstar family protein [Streptomyces sp. NEAU-H22]WMD02977.1 barstar family protein [Streptomyces sp. FXY-T5]